jgi:protein-S-isoprenylcysteine O-methyltransferase Ste14
MDKSQKSGHSTTKRLAALIVEGVFFVGVIPYCLVAASSFFDNWLQIPRFTHGVATVVGIFFVVVGIFFALWSIQVQYTQGKGTPAPFMATQALVVKRPYSYCRNPMSLGTILFYVGVSVWIGSLSAAGFTILFAGLLLVYIKTVEEKELEERFGPAYTEYKQNTPFLVPRLQRKRSAGDGKE